MLVGRGFQIQEKTVRATAVAVDFFCRNFLEISVICFYRDATNPKVVFPPFDLLHNYFLSAKDRDVCGVGGAADGGSGRSIFLLGH